MLDKDLVLDRPVELCKSEELDMVVVSAVELCCDVELAMEVVGNAFCSQIKIRPPKCPRIRSTTRIKSVKITIA